jgi:hypothetical protein
MDYLTSHFSYSLLYANKTIKLPPKTQPLQSRLSHMKKYVILSYKN